MPRAHALFDRAFELLDRVAPPAVAYAHCDIPCGIYDPHAAQIAALSVIRMVQLIQGLAKPGDAASKDEWDLYTQQISRYVQVKEEHARIAEQEIIILWTDYFKPEHLDKVPNLHETVWKTSKLTSTVKQQINMEASQNLLAGCQEIAEMFWKTKGIQTQRRPSNQPAGGEIVYPVTQ